MKPYPQTMSFQASAISTQTNKFTRALHLLYRQNRPFLSNIILFHIFLSTQTNEFTLTKSNIDIIPPPYQNSSQKNIQPCLCRLLQVARALARQRRALTPARLADAQRPPPARPPPLLPAPAPAPHPRDQPHAQQPRRRRPRRPAAAPGHAQRAVRHGHARAPTPRRRHVQRRLLQPQDRGGEPDGYTRW